MIMPNSFAELDNAPDLWSELWPQPNAQTNKYTRGSVLIRGGAVMTGAARLAARAAQRIGAGLVTLASPTSALPIYATALESVIVRPVDTIDQWRALVNDVREPAMLIGPGCEVGDQTHNETLDALKTKRSCVMDAGALSSFAGQSTMLHKAIHKNCVLTPHEGEFTRLFGSSALTPDRVSSARKAAQEMGCVVLLKGAETIIAAPEGGVVINRNAPSWLATAGSGDVLAGLIVGLLAQKMPIFWASAAATWVHGRAALNHGPGLIAEDIVATLPTVLANKVFLNC